MTEIPKITDSSVGGTGSPCVSPATVRWMAVALCIGSFVAAVRFHTIPWIQMWALAGSLFFLWKRMALAGNSHPLPPHRVLAFLLLWPGMDVLPWQCRVSTSGPALHWIKRGTVGVIIGIICLILLPLPFENEVLVGWLGMCGVIGLLHFGIFDWLAAFWRSSGYAVRPLMGNPLRSTNLAEFWGGTWNRGFSDVAARRVTRPLVRKRGGVPALWAAFLVSGLIHDVVISVPAGGGYGLPTLYFIIQGLGMSFERRHRGYRSKTGRLWVAAWVALPVPLLFHPPFMINVITPFVRTLNPLI